VRPPVLLLVATLGLLAACSDPKKLECHDSIAHACATPGNCVLTWAEAQNDTAFCSIAAQFPPSRADCGGYHVVTVSVIDVSGTYYYDATTGMLVAIVHAGLGGTECVAGPAGGFTLPKCTEGSEDLPQCLDGGADGGTGDGGT
jgi:hypothetical protein